MAQCTNCNSTVPAGVSYCPNCGASVQPIPTANYSASHYSSSNPVTNPAMTPLSPWAYVGYTVLFAIPLIGFICCIIFASSNENINRRNYARGMLLTIAICVVLSVLSAIISGSWLASILSNTYFPGM